MPFFALQAEGQPPFDDSQGVGPVVGWRDVTPNYFSVLGISLLRGRPFTEEDRSPAVHTIIINEALAKRLFPDQDPLGKTVQFHTDRAALSAPFTVVAIAANAQNQGLGGQVGPEYYMVRHHTENDVVFNYPDSQRMSMVVRGAIRPQAVAQELRTVVASLDPTIPVDTSTLSQNVAKLGERPRFSAALLSFFAAVGLLLTALGIYGVVSLLVNQRTQEIGVRMALGATRKNVVTLIVRQASLWIVIGGVLGVSGSLAMSRWISSLLFGIRGNDPVTLAGATLGLVLVALMAAWIPARRTAKVDPMVALRCE
jgi:predicted permease